MNWTRRAKKDKSDQLEKIERKPGEEYPSVTTSEASDVRIVTTVLGNPFSGSGHETSTGPGGSGVRLWNRGDHLFDALACIAILTLCWYLTFQRPKHAEVAGAIPAGSGV